MSGTRHALVTGSSSGIGLAIAERLLGDGWRVTGLDRAPAALADERFASRTVDLADAEATVQAASTLGPVDALVHAAGIMRGGAVGEVDAKTASLMWRIHVAAAQALGAALLPAMPEGGRVVLIGSRAANGAPRRADYAATKAALVGLARSWAMELLPRRITVNVIAPAATDTAMIRDPARAGIAVRLPPGGRLIEASEVAGLAAFLISEEARSITGQQITICAGASL
ncbi:SDR family NAD(P)-dependent oxidoreductase [Elioraea rosea]|uniref:SDR family NAD(P)-dependent oxidoreductase n=1 Tax=Elioraea rosea TaxID=2492390 RepID=UPI0011836488|nr:SDR family oxidoreductase [Elioraea rosea]